MNRFAKPIVWILCFAILSVLSACGGGGGGGGEPPPPPPSGSSNWDQLIWDQDKWG